MNKNIAKQWSFVSAAVGTAFWFVGPSVPLGNPPTFGCIEHVFLLFPLVAAPLAFCLRGLLIISHAPKSLLSAALFLQLPASLLLFASFCTPKGTSAGLSSVPWLLTAVLVCIGGARASFAQNSHSRVRLNLVAAHVFLPVGAVWLLLSRLGVGPRHFSELTVFLAAVHFHFSGFALQLLIAATGRALDPRWSRLLSLHRLVALAAVAGILALAVGNLMAVTTVKFGGVLLVAGATLGLAVTLFALAATWTSALPKGLAYASCASSVCAMSLAGVYGFSEFLDHHWVDLETMVRLHGLANAFGFTLCGLLGHLFARQ